MSVSKKAICVLTEGKLKGYIFFTEHPTKKEVSIEYYIQGLSKGKYGFHIHEFGDLRNGCSSLGSHFNPKGKNHGSHKSKERHIGDLGNIHSNGEKIVKGKLKDKLIKLRGINSIIGRSIVIHSKEDDLGLGGLDSKGKVINNKIHKESIKTGNAGKRIGCGIIGLAK